MAFTDRSLIFRQTAASASWAKELFAATLLLALLLALALRAMFELKVLAPAVATLLFAVAGVIAGISMLCRQDHLRRRLWLDVAGLLTFLGVAITLLIEPDQIVRLVTPSEQPD
jgi:hypothetical protein